MSFLLTGVSQLRTPIMGMSADAARQTAACSNLSVSAKGPESFASSPFWSMSRASESWCRGLSCELPHIACLGDCRAVVISHTGMHILANLGNS